MTRLLLVRHGESEWNALGRWQGWADPPLSELAYSPGVGVAQTNEVGFRQRLVRHAVVSGDVESQLFRRGERSRPEQTGELLAAGMTREQLHLLPVAAGAFLEGPGVLFRRRAVEVGEGPS